MYAKHLEECHSYKTREGAAKAAASKLPEDVRWMVAVREDGRFVPVAILLIDQQWMAGAIAHHKIAVFG